MPNIELIKNTSSSVTLRLSNLDVTFAQGTRQTRWYLYDESRDLIEIKDGEDLEINTVSGGKVTFSDLSPSTVYIVICNIYFGGVLLNVAQESVTTLDGGGGDSSSFYRTMYYLGNVTAERSSTQVLDDWNETVCWSMSFQNSGTASFELLCRYKYDVYFGSSSTFDYDSGEPSSYLIHKTGNTGNTSGISVSITYDVRANTTYYIHTNLRVDVTDQNITLTVTPPSERGFEWSNAMAKGLPTNGVSYTEWNDFCDAVIAKKGSAYSSLLESQKMSSVDNEITAKRFNTVRAVIDYGLTLDIEEKKTAESRVIADEFIILAENIN